jgi:hypothetical protein
MLPIIDNPVFLAAFAGIALVSAILLAAFKRRHDRQMLKPLAVYAAADSGKDENGFSRQLDRNGYYTASFLAHLLLAGLVSGLCVGIFFLMMQSSATLVELAPGDHSYDIMMMTWLLTAFIMGLTWHALFSVLREQRIYLSGRGKDKTAPDVFVQGNDLYASIAVTDGIAHDLLLLSGKPFLRLPLDEVSACKIERRDIVFTLPGQEKGFALQRRALGQAEKPLVEAIEKKLKNPLSLSA